MPIRTESFDFISNLDTLWAVVAGAVLATAGGMIASQLEHRVNARRRERDTAIFFGEIMHSANNITEAADAARAIGDPYGPVTLRLLRMVRRELDVYDRNRERLFEIRDPAIRARIHKALVRVFMGLEGTLEAASEIEELDRQLLGAGLTDGLRKNLGDRLADQRNRREQSFSFLKEAAGQAAELARALEPIAQVNFATLLEASRED